MYKSCLSGFVLLYLVVCLCFSMRSLVCLFMLLPSHSFPAGSFASVSQHVQGASHVETQSTACYQSIHILKHASWIQWPLLWVTWFPWLPAKVWKKPWDLRVQLRKIKDTRKNYKKKCRFLFKAGQCASVWLIGKSSTVTSAGLEVVSPLGTLTVRKSLMKIKHVLQNMWRICELRSSSQGGHCDSVILKHIK